MNNGDTTGLAAERLDRVRRMLKQRGVVRVDELCEELGVSPATVRRDLAEMDRLGQVQRVHGGAVRVGGRLDEPGFEDKASTAAREKQCIAEAALKFVKSRDCIFLDGGSTVLSLARLLVERDQLTVMTNSMLVASTFSEDGPNTILTGGELRRISQTFVGSVAAPLIEQLHPDVAFLGTIGISAEEGMTTTDPREALTKSLVVSRAQQVILLADSTKIGRVSFVEFGALDRLDVLITDSGADKKELKKFRKKGIKIVLGS